jgi:sigma-B regulation protein RsbU (phosphoserine phosphatase)
VSDDAELFEHAPCGYVVGAGDGTIVRANRAFALLIGIDAAQLAGRRLQDLLTIGGRIHHETHVAPLLAMAGRVSEIAVDFRRSDGTTVPALITAERHGDTVRTIVFEATDRRNYERELVRAREREHAIAAELQRALLAGALPEDPALEIGVAYRPAEGLEVGGDWYDAFWLEDGRVGVAVGDGVGRGIGAATTMGQLRSALRALAASGGAARGPGAMLEALDRYTRRHDIGRMTTVAYAELDLRDGTVAFACAGHPPPAVAAGDGTVTFAWDGRSAPLDATARPEPRPEGTLTLDPGGLLVLYTDGLIERVDRPLQQGLDALLIEIASHRAEPVDALADAVTRAALAGRRTTDDASLLALRRRAA